MVDQVGAAVFDTVYNEVSTDEDIGVYEGRCKEWGDVTEEVWASLLSACTDVPATVLDNVADKDGKAAWNKFLARWNSVSISTTMAGLWSSCWTAIQRMHPWYSMLLAGKTLSGSSRNGRCPYRRAPCVGVDAFPADLTGQVP
jgi:hypothetical protein